MSYAYTAAQIRAAEKPLLEAQDFPDQLMQQAASAVCDVAQAMVRADDHPLAAAVQEATGNARDVVLILAGKGGNGGDGLYAGAQLAMQGLKVEAFLTGGQAHEPALTAFRQAGGVVLEQPPTHQECARYRIAIDAITGIGGRGGLDDDTYDIVTSIRGWYVPVLAVDVPSGVEADTGVAHPQHVTADVTVTFGEFRLAHGLAPQCGQQLLAEIGNPALSNLLREQGSHYLVWRATQPVHIWPDGTWPEHLRTMLPPGVSRLEPGADDDKYTGGVVGIRAGSGTYPGAALLTVRGAVNATPAMVRYAGPQALEVVRAHPEVVVTKSIDEATRVQAWVFGPGAGTDNSAAAELEQLLNTELPVLVDADGLTLLTEHEELRALVVKREATTVLTPHDGEFARLRQACGLDQTHRLAETEALAAHLQATVVRKGRATIIAGGPHTHIIDAGHSWSATPGSGDVLAGIAGAHLARVAAQSPQLAQYALDQVVAIHAVAAKLSATTKFGQGPTSATKIADAVPAASAQLAAPS
ncbi:bifunctional ADP-dependent NAD(P)H-hydrate dehydratase/NAD(P)H-hydrate epimerase [Corynebacterium cystitidis]|uniref:bifunctional ADP-dependent NAD(P)H-hydrate dehydratase/NAD(P)H-hydrate epimerase n=1 Tax=Corynebacterium cystitidis TaxID=35757 RepID=UPI00211DFB12|nr:bifunctional ADP-dependent NAD(P)H-hydrate dehydratase/NAD(P)H-hydrate epimerase [Corynebacterium cystitidis]